MHTLLKYHDYKNLKLNKLVSSLSVLGFGAYLVHAFFIEKLAEVIGLDTLSFNVFVSVPAISAIVFVLSFGVSAIFSRIPVIKKYCI